MVSADQAQLQRLVSRGPGTSGVSWLERDVRRGKRRGRQQYLPKSSEFKVEQRRDRSGTEVPKSVCLMFPMPLPVPRHVSDVYVFTASLRIHTLHHCVEAERRRQDRLPLPTVAVV